jgi:hypothetical protein
LAPELPLSSRVYALPLSWPASASLAAFLAGFLFFEAFFLEAFFFAVFFFATRFFEARFLEARFLGRLLLRFFRGFFLRSFFLRSHVQLLSMLDSSLSCGLSCYPHYQASIRIECSW